MKQKVKTEKEWHALRRQCITASQAANLVGCNPYGSVAALKKADDFEGNAFTIIGQALEPIVVQAVNDVLDECFALFEVEKDCKTFYMKDNLGATPDAHNGGMLLECKSTRPHSYIKYSSVPPLQYIIQTQVQMFCAEYEACYLAIMSTNLTQKTVKLEWPITIYKILRCDRICAILKKEAERFYKDIQKFKVNKDLKQKVKLLGSMCYEKIY